EVKPILGAAFKLDAKQIDFEELAELWQAYKLPELPEDFDWQRICKQYVKRVQNGLMTEISELREIVRLQNQRAIRASVEAIA
ncbi:MAG: hypothetical protein AAFQ89_17590, partial [Cyanobacteria bacterium J06626_18]